MIIVYAFSTPNSVKVPVMLEELGIAYDLRSVNIRTGEQKAPAYLALNPNGKVPLLVDDDLVIAEFGAILIYLAEKHGQFLATDPATRARTFEWLMVQMSGTGPAFGQSGFWQKLASERNEAAIGRYQGEANRLADLIDAHLGRHQWFAGDQFSIADIAHFGWFWRREFAGVTLDSRRNLARWYAEVEQRPAVQRGVQRTSALAAPPTA
ncbi:MAG: glutathione S-transferase family protein [Beijerinckiaceae bacterium]